jgi:hypothetical protein
VDFPIFGEFLRWRLAWGGGSLVEYVISLFFEVVSLNMRFLALILSAEILARLEGIAVGI